MCHVLTWAEDAVDTVKFFLSPRLIMQTLVAVYYIVRRTLCMKSPKIGGAWLPLHVTDGVPN